MPLAPIDKMSEEELLSVPRAALSNVPIPAVSVADGVFLSGARADSPGGRDGPQLAKW
jgi:hypothetical protein